MEDKIRSFEYAGRQFDIRNWMYHQGICPFCGAHSVNMRMVEPGDPGFEKFGVKELDEYWEARIWRCVSCDKLVWFHYPRDKAYGPVVKLKTPLRGITGIKN